MNQFDKHLAIDVLLQAMFGDSEASLASVRDQVAELRAKRCSELAMENLLLIREELEMQVGVFDASLAGLYSLCEQLDLREQLLSEILPNPVALIVCDLHEAISEYRRENSEAQPTVKESLTYALRVAERFNVSSVTELQFLLETGSPSEVLEKHSQPSSEIAAIIPAPVMSGSDALTARALKFDDTRALSDYCHRNGLSEQDIPELTYLITKFSISAGLIEQALERGLSLEEFGRQLRLRDEFEIEIIDTHDLSELSAGQRDQLHGHIWAVESSVLSKFCDHFGLSSDGLEDDTSDLMSALDRCMRLFPGTLNECLKQAMQVAVSQETNDFECFVERLDEQGHLHEVPRRERVTFVTEVSAPDSEVGTSASEEVDEEDQDFDIPEIGA